MTARTSVDAGPRRLTVVLFPGFELLDVFGPVELCQAVPGLEIDYAARVPGLVPSSQGVQVLAEAAWQDVEPDILLVPGGPGTRAIAADQRQLNEVAELAGRASVVSSVCTGSAVLAAAGALAGYRATSNKRAFEWVASCGEGVEWDPSARWVHDRDRWTSSGVAAGMDMACALITWLFGAESARESARRCEYTPNSDPSADPFALDHELPGADAPLPDARRL
ncbi:DJ-1/PfpI family protein [Kocuria sp.]|uniref:DJ-1/PfpI family protein n=1 Tax=Kocuria sp. TaxID=1871328 RepID=UPI0026DC60C8|nr:DJ-1/PfpI family protein [Kocuria sp.]MDO4919434.1 DJ-1/PfpI family protein [Kocuria sp.]